MAKFTGVELEDSDTDTYRRIRKKYPERWAHTKDLKYHGPKFKIDITFDASFANVFAIDENEAINIITEYIKNLKEDGVHLEIDGLFIEQVSDGDLPKEKLEKEYEARESLFYD